MCLSSDHLPLAGRSVACDAWLILQYVEHLVQLASNPSHSVSSTSIFIAEESFTNSQTTEQVGIHVLACTYYVKCSKIIIMLAKEILAECELEQELFGKFYSDVLTQKGW